uniref:Uncharacterized protein n=1 Tax=Romanomermis culicivorax TaxID=13658 RepID=A0A915KEX0_ROMCU
MTTETAICETQCSWRHQGRACMEYTTQKPIQLAIKQPVTIPTIFRALTLAQTSAVNMTAGLVTNVIDTRPLCAELATFLTVQ